MADLEARLSRLEDEAAIRNLIARYGPLADRGDAAGVAALWTEQGTYEVGGYGVAKGHDAIAALISGETHQALMATGCAHVLSPHRIDLDGDTAVAVGYSLVLRRTGESFEVWRASANRWRLIRTPEGWRVEARVNAPLDGQAASRALFLEETPA